MNEYRTKLPQLEGGIFLTDGGLETTLIFTEGQELPCFAAFTLLQDDNGIDLLRRYFSDYLAIAAQAGTGFILESPTWRASRDWAIQIGYDRQELAAANRRAIDLMQDLGKEYRSPRTPIVVSGNIGPRGDGYRVGHKMTVEQARDYHEEQVAVFAETTADMVSAFTINYVEEAAGLILAARHRAIPIVVSFTVETDGRLPSGEELSTAISRTDALTDGYAAYYMINCAHPVHFAAVLGTEAPAFRRIKGIRANASRQSHAELDNCCELDDGDPAELGRQYRHLRNLMPWLTVLGGCCGTDSRHIQAIADSLQQSTVDQQKPALQPV